MLSQLLQRMMARANQARDYRIYYTLPDSHWYMHVIVRADSSYAAARWFDTNPDFFGYRRRAIV